MQSLKQAVDLSKDDPAKNEVGRMCLDFAGVLLQTSMYGNDYWRLQVLTDLDELPDYERSPGAVGLGRQ